MSRDVLIIKDGSSSEKMTGNLKIEEGSINLYVSRPIEILYIDNDNIREELFYKISNKFTDFLKFLSYSIKARDILFLFLNSFYFFIIPIFIFFLISFLKNIIIYEAVPIDSKNIFYKTAIFRFLDNKNMSLDALALKNYEEPIKLIKNLSNKIISNKKNIDSNIKEVNHTINDEDEDELFFLDQM